MDSANKDQARRIRQVSAILYNSREEGKPDTVELRCNDDGRVLADKRILVAGSDYFRAMFNHGNMEDETNIATFPDTSSEVMEIIIKFLYAQDIPVRAEISDTLLGETLIAANKMQLNILFDNYWPEYKKSVTVDNFLDIWRLAEMFNEDETVQKVRLFVSHHTRLISDTNRLVGITTNQMTSLDKVRTVKKAAELIVFYLNWWKLKSSAMESSTEHLLEFISKCGIKDLSDHSLRTLLLSDAVNKSAEVYSVVSKVVASRWLAAKSQPVEISVFEITSRRCIRKNSYLMHEEWEYKEEWINDIGRATVRYPALSRRNEMFYFTYMPHRLGLRAIEASTGDIFNQPKHFALDNVSCETANRSEIYFRRSSHTYSCFYINSKIWHVVDFLDHISDCKYLLLAAEDDSYYFDVDELHIKVVNFDLGTCVTKEKLPGNWQRVMCKSRVLSSSETLIFVQKIPNRCLLIYDIESDCWSVVSSPNIDGEVFLYVCYDEDCLIFTKTGVSYNVYSLNTMNKVNEYKMPTNFNGCIHFDVSVIF